MDKKSKRAATLIIFLCWAAYTAAYIGRLNFNAYIEPIRDQIGAMKTELGLISVTRRKPPEYKKGKPHKVFPNVLGQNFTCDEINTR